LLGRRAWRHKKRSAAALAIASQANGPTRGNRIGHDGSRNANRKFDFVRFADAPSITGSRYVNHKIERRCQARLKLTDHKFAESRGRPPVDHPIGITGRILPRAYNPDRIGQERMPRTTIA
jgi:hypothetical protein